MSPQTRDLYERIKLEHPDIYEHLRDIDTELAELHLSGMNLQIVKQKLIEKVTQFDQLKPRIL